MKNLANATLHGSHGFALAVALSLTWSGTGQAFEFVWNGNFDSDLAGWERVDGPGPNPLPPVWSILDSGDQGVSGSVLLTNTLLTMNFRPYLSQCFTVEQIPGDDHFTFSADAYIYGGQQRGSMIASVRVYHSVFCEGAAAAPPSMLIFDSQDGTNVWQRRVMSWSHEYSEETNGRISMLLQLGSGNGIVNPPDPEDNFRGHFDAVKLANGWIFADGFEDLL